MQVPTCHVVHFVYRFSAGGLENVIVQLINHLPRHEFHHTVIALTEIDSTFAMRVERKDVEFIGLGKPPGQPFRFYPKLYRLLRKLKPDVFHSCNLAAMEMVPVAALAGVPLRVHAEHGWDMGEIREKGVRYLRLRKMYKPFVHEFIAVAASLYAYLEQSLGISTKHLHLIPNGVDTERFRPRRGDDALPHGFPFRPDEHWVIGMVGRLVPIKNPMMLVDAFLSLTQSKVPGSERMRLAIVGEGPLDEQIKQRMQAAGQQDRLWLPGVRADIAEILRAMDCFVLPSLSEATSCTLQEAMATGLQIIATDVGGNSELLEGGHCGSLIASENTQALAEKIKEHFAARIPGNQAAIAVTSVQKRYGLPIIIQRYRELFLLGRT